MARVSAVVPIHNAGPRLVETLDSMLAQTYGDWEAVLVDDASTDASATVAARYAAAHPQRFRAVVLPVNVGVAAARNAGVAASSGGELVALLDHDDRWEPRYLERLVGAHDAAVAAGRRPGIVACDAFIETAEGTILGETYAEHYWWSDALDLDRMLEFNWIMGRVLFTRAGFDEVGGFSPACRVSDDYDLWLRLLEAGYGVATVREPLVVWRRHAAAQSLDRGLLSEGGIAVYRRALARGALSPSQRRTARRRIRHHRALVERARVRQAAAERRRVLAAARALRAAPHGLVAFAQDPSRWGEWLPVRRLAHRARGSDA